MRGDISSATKRNWEKLEADSTDKLTKRANKRMSRKRFVPVEYFVNTDNVLIMQDNIEQLSHNGNATFDIIASLAVLMLKRAKIYEKEHVQKTVFEYKFSLITEINDLIWPEDEQDLLGIVYQSLLFEGVKNEKGSYYTPIAVTKNMVSNLTFANGETFLDPCCGSGSFLLSLNAEDPNQIYGVDNDPIAVFIAKINLLIRYSTHDFFPHIECRDYLAETDLFSLNSEIRSERFDYIITNPPWGALADKKKFISEISSGETFSYFFVKSFGQLKKGGTIRFLLPEAVLNVKVHKDIREFILNNSRIEAFTIYDDSFTGVTTKYVDICCSNNSSLETTKLICSTYISEIAISSFHETENLVFNFLADEDIEIVSRVKEIGKYNLSNSIWALGVVTGDNKKKLFSSPEPGMEIIYTGKEIVPYGLKEAKNYLFYDRSKLQQVAKEEYYRAKEKLVYKFISKKLTFAYDNEQRLFLNSANILIPNIPGMDIKTVMAFLNSELYQFLYIQMFGEVKILKGNLIELPFPLLSETQNKFISRLVDLALQGEDVNELLQDSIYQVFELDEKQKKYIRRSLYGKVA